MHVPFKMVAKSSGGDQVINPSTNPWPRCDKGWLPNKLIVVDCLVGQQPTRYSDGWINEHPKPNPKVGRAIQF